MKLFTAALLGATMLAGMAGSAMAQQLTIGVSWNNFQEERWGKWDAPAIQAVLEAAGAKYISTDAQSSASKQLADVENLISQAPMRSSSWRRTRTPSVRPCRSRGRGDPGRRL